MAVFLSVKTKLYFGLMLITFLILAGCTSSRENENGSTTIDAITTDSTVTRFIVPNETGTLAPTVVMSSTIAVIISPTDTATPPPRVLTPVATLTLPISTPTFTPVATLSVEQEGEFLSRLMADNGGCELPCWWGTTPGLTNEQEARDIFASQGVDDWVLSFDATYALMGLGYPRAGSSFYTGDVNVEFGIENNLIRYIRVDGGYRQNELRPAFIQDWQLYSPARMLSDYGLPFYVEMAKIENSPYYRLIFSYPLSGIEIGYIVPFEALGSSRRRICFALEHIDFVALSLYSPDQATDIPFNIIPNRLDTYISWEATTGLAIEAFYQLFESITIPPCIELGLNQ